MAEKKKSYFELLERIDVTHLMEKKGRFTYLSWAHAVRELRRLFPEATWEVHEYADKDGEINPYMHTDCGYFVKVTVTVDGVPMTQIHPVLDNYNKAIENPNAFEINTSIQRCLAKAIALHGLGLHIFAGEDLPPSDPLTAQDKSDIVAELEKAKVEKEQYTQIMEKLKNSTININNKQKAITYIRSIANG